MRISTRPPISPAKFFTARVSVRSSGTSDTCGSDDSRSKPGGFFHGSAKPPQTRSAPAFTNAGAHLDWGGFAQPWKKTERKNTRLNSSHVKISYDVFCLKKKKRK